MVSSRGISVMVCVTIGLGCIGSVLRGHGGDSGAVVRIAALPEPGAAAPRPPAPHPAETAAVDTTLTTGSIAPGSALHVPNPAAYADAAKQGSSLILTGAEAINYLAGNTLRREGPGEPLHFTYFASRGLMGDGNEHGFTARRWDRNQPDLCETGPDGVAECRSVSILLDGKYEFPGARLGTVTLGAPSSGSGAPSPAAGSTGVATAVLVKGNAMHFPEYIPFLDSTVGMAAATAPTANGEGRATGPAAIDRILGHAAVATGDGGTQGRQVVLYGRDNRRLELRQVEDGEGGAKAVRVTVGHWRATKASLCQTRSIGDAGQDCFKLEGAADGAIRLLPTGKAGEAQTIMTLPETGARDIAQD